MSTPRWNARSCGVYDMPPATSARRQTRVRASGASTSATCMASSRVGTRTRPRAQPEAALAPARVGDHRQAEGERLARPGLPAAEHVAAGERIRDGGALDRERLGDPGGGELGDQALRHAEIGEAAAGGRDRRQRGPRLRRRPAHLVGVGVRTERRASVAIVPLRPVTALETITALRAVTSVETITALRPIAALEAIGPLGPVAPLETITALRPITALETITALRPIAALEAIGPLGPVAALEAIGPLGPVAALETITALRPITPVETITALRPVAPLVTITALRPIAALERSVRAGRRSDHCAGAGRCGQRARRTDARRCGAAGDPCRVARTPTSAAWAYRRPCCSWPGRSGPT